MSIQVDPANEQPGGGTEGQVWDVHDDVARR